MNKAVLLLFLSAVSVLVASPAAHATPCTLAGLQWMAGDWRNSTNPGGAQERWTEAPGGILMGSSWESSQDGKGYAEAMTVRQDAGSIRMVLRHFDLALSKAWEERAST
jgi:hypothetical protein